MIHSVDEIRVEIHADVDIIKARSRGRELAGRLGFSSSEMTLIATVISELARNILQYATSGEILIGAVTQDGRPGITVMARDRGPGIRDVQRAMSVGYSTSGGLGLGLPGARRLMDEMEIASQVGGGTTVTTRKWQR